MYFRFKVSNEACIQFRKQISWPRRCVPYLCPLFDMLACSGEWFWFQKFRISVGILWSCICIIVWWKCLVLRVTWPGGNWPEWGTDGCDFQLAPPRPLNNDVVSIEWVYLACTALFIGIPVHVVYPYMGMSGKAFDNAPRNGLKYSVQTRVRTIESTDTIRVYKPVIYIILSA